MIAHCRPADIFSLTYANSSVRHMTITFWTQRLYTLPHLVCEADVESVEKRKKLVKVVLPNKASFYLHFFRRATSG